MDKDASNQRTCVHWLPIGTEGDVPGAVTTSLIRGTTFQKIKKSGVLEYSQLLYNKYSETETYKIDGLDNTEQSFYALLSTEDCEDLLCLWLYAKYGYITIPSSNKKSTKLYECQLKNPANGDNIYVQVKVNSTIDAGKYSHLEGEVYLFSPSNSILNGNNVASNIKLVNSKELYDFAMSDAGRNLLSQSILHCVDFLKSRGTVN